MLFTTRQYCPDTALASDLERLRGVHRRVGGEVSNVVGINFTRALNRKRISCDAENGVVHHDDVEEPVRHVKVVAWNIVSSRQ
jgi:hypothetical protein